MSDKKFGLIIPKKADKFKMQVKSVFGDESDEDEKQSNRPKIPQKKSQYKSKVKAEILEDPSIYEYDSIYDEMKAKEAESIAPKEKKNSRYIETLLKAADKRKKEYEKRIDKKIQAERENEGDMYKDKEAFVTSSYKKKLQEKEEEEERERRENMLNDMMDITKQKDLSGFYRHFLKQTVGEEKIPVFGAKDIKKEVSSRENSPVKGRYDDDAKKQDESNIDQDSDGIEIDSESDASDSKYKKSTCTDDIRRKHYDGKDENLRRKTNRSDDSGDKSNQLNTLRKKHKTHHRRTNYASSSESLSSDEDEDVASNKKRPHSTRKLDSHPSRHDSSSDGDKVSKSYKKEKQKCSKKDRYTNSSANTKSSMNTNYSSSSDSELSVESKTLNKKSSDYNKKADKKHSRHDSSSSDDVHKEKESEKLIEEEKAPKKNKSRKNIYTKRTVGEIFISAQARYFQRMALKT